MGCKAVTPHLVSLAKRLEGRPFHLVAAHNQNDTKENVVAYMKSNGLSDDTTNLTVTSRGRHSKVKGNGYVPYYMVFDHHGDLAHHHMCGAKKKMEAEKKKKEAEAKKKLEEEAKNKFKSFIK